MKLERVDIHPVRVELVKVSEFDPNVILITFEEGYFRFLHNNILGPVWQLVQEEFLAWNFLSFTFDSLLSFVCHFKNDKRIWLCDFANPQEPVLACFREFDSTLTCVDYAGQQIAARLSNGCLYWFCRKQNRQLIKHSDHPVDILKCLQSAFITAHGNEIQLWMAEQDLMCVRKKVLMSDALNYLDVCSVSQCELLYCATNAGTIWFYWLVDDEDLPLYILDINEVLTAVASLRWQNETFLVCGTSSGNVICFLGNQIVQSNSFPEPVVAIEKAYPNQFIVCFASGCTRRYEPWSQTWTTLVVSLTPSPASSECVPPVPARLSDAISEDSFAIPTPQLPPEIIREKLNATISSTSIPRPMMSIPQLSEFRSVQSPDASTTTDDPDATLPPQTISEIPASMSALEMGEEAPIPQIIPNSIISIPKRPPMGEPFELFRHTKARAQKTKLMNQAKMNQVLEQKAKNVESKSDFAKATPQTVLRLDENLRKIKSENFVKTEHDEEVKWQTEMLGTMHPKFATLNHEQDCFRSLPPPAESLKEHKVMKIRRLKPTKRKKPTIEDFSCMKEFQSSRGIKPPKIPKLVRHFEL